MPQRNKSQRSTKRSLRQKVRRVKAACSKFRQRHPLRYNPLNRSRSQHHTAGQQRNRNPLHSRRCPSPVCRSMPVDAPYPTGGYPQQPLPPMPQYEHSYPGVDPLGMPVYDNPNNPPAYRPEEYAEYVDFPQSMVSPASQTATYHGSIQQ